MKQVRITDTWGDTLIIDASLPGLPVVSIQAKGAEGPATAVALDAEQVREVVDCLITWGWNK